MNEFDKWLRGFSPTARYEGEVEMDETLPGTEHELKTWPVYYNATIGGDKPFEIRLNDRDFKVGDRLKLREFGVDGYTGRWCRVVVTFVFEPNMFASFGVMPHYVVMGIRPIEAAHE